MKSLKFGEIKKAGNIYSVLCTEYEGLKVIAQSKIYAWCKNDIVQHVKKYGQ